MRLVDVLKVLVAAQQSNKFGWLSNEGNKEVVLDQRVQESDFNMAVQAVQQGTRLMT